MSKYGFSAAFLFSLLASFVACASESSLGDHGGDSSCDADSIEGGYDYTETYEGTCPSGAPPGNVFESTVSVTLTGDDAKITNGTDTLIHCTLSGCKCTTTGGDVFKWSDDGFERIAHDGDDCTITTTGKKK